MWLVSIEDRLDRGSPYYTVATTSQQEVEQLEALATKKGLDAVVRHADGFQSAINWMREQ